MKTEWTKKDWRMLALVSLGCLLVMIGTNLYSLHCAGKLSERYEAALDKAYGVDAAAADGIADEQNNPR